MMEKDLQDLMWNIEHVHMDIKQNRFVDSMDLLKFTSAQRNLIDR